MTNRIASRGQPRSGSLHGAHSTRADSEFETGSHILFAGVIFCPVIIVLGIVFFYMTFVA